MDTETKAVLYSILAFSAAIFFMALFAIKPEADHTNLMYFGSAILVSAVIVFALHFKTISDTLEKSCDWVSSLIWEAIKGVFMLAWYALCAYGLYQLFVVNPLYGIIFLLFIIAFRR